MTDKQQPTTTTDAPEPSPADNELYVEPPRMSRRDTIEVLVAVLLLVIIGIAGYNWLTPNASVAVQDSAPAGDTVADAASDDAAGTEVVPAADHGVASGAAATEHRCEYCGMYAHKSRAHIRAEWTDGSVSHHDSFDCLFNYGLDEGLTFASAQVAHYESDPADPQWLDVTTAMYLYDTTEPVAGSMPPYVAAGSCTSCTGKLRPELGGTEMDWPTLAAQWPEAAAAIGVLEST